MVKVQATIINTVEPTLEPIVFPAYAREEVSVVVAKRNIERVHTVVHTARNELREDHRCTTVKCSVSQVVLPRTAERSIDHPVLGLFIVGCSGGNR